MQYFGYMYIMNFIYKPSVDSELIDVCKLGITLRPKKRLLEYSQGRDVITPYYKLIQIDFKSTNSLYTFLC